MKSRSKFQYIGLILGLFILIMTFQNMSLVDFGRLNMPEIDEGARHEQARELLGTFYTESSAQKLEGKQHLNYLVYKKVDSALGRKWKARVPELVQTLISESQKQELDPIFILAIIQTESSFNPRAEGTSGEIGLMQILPTTAEWLAKRYKIPWRGPKSLYDPITNVRLGILYFAHLRSQFVGRAYHYVPAYNMGPGNMRKIDRKIGSLQPNGQVQKRQYALKVMGHYATIYQQLIDEHAKLTQLVNVPINHEDDQAGLLTDTSTASESLQ